MARQEEPREDLLREATALVERVELAVDGFAEPIVAGFRRDGAASFFFGQQMVYQFNTAFQLRRAFLDGHLYKSENGRLAQLIRQRTADEVHLQRHDLTDDETLQFLATARQRLHALHAALTARLVRLIGQVPPQSDVVERLCDWLAKLPDPIPLACSPRVG